MSTEQNGTGRSTRQVLVTVVRALRTGEPQQYITSSDAEANSLAVYCADILNDAGIVTTATASDGYTVAVSATSSITFRDYTKAQADIPTTVDHSAESLVSAEGAKARALLAVQQIMKESGLSAADIQEVAQ